MRKLILMASVGLLLSISAVAQESRSEISLQGTGFFTLAGNWLLHKGFFRPRDNRTLHERRRISSRISLFADPLAGCRSGLWL